MLLAGDNFYTNLTSTTDPMWQTMFEQMYDPDVLKFPFFVSLGNHDYQNGKSEIERAYAREHPESRWKFPARYYRVELPEKDPLVTILMLDSNHQAMSDADWNAETFWLKTELEKPRNTRWLICCSHHPFFSNGNHGDNGALQAAWGPLFMKNHVDLFVAGHDHDIQHLEIPKLLTSLILVGGGGQSLRPMRVDVRGPFSKSTYGFGAINLTKDAMTVRLVNKDGEVLHEFRRTPDRHVEILETTPSDPATPRTIGSITRDNEATTKKSKKANSDD
jgi:tartrate-resistant acid phosphatase type 5